MAEQGVQTNEVQRSWVLAPLILRAVERTGAPAARPRRARPERGLNLLWDRYRLRYAVGSRGPEEADVVLAGDERGHVPSRLVGLECPPVLRRTGIDRSPIDVTTEEGARLLTCFVWADQHERITRLGQAIEAVRRDPPELLRGDVADGLPEVLSRRPPGAVTVVFQTAVLGYVADDARVRLRAALDAAGSEAPLAFVSAGRARAGEDGWGLRITSWPDGEREFAGHADYHGAWLDWRLP